MSVIEELLVRQSALIFFLTQWLSNIIDINQSHSPFQSYRRQSGFLQFPESAFWSTCNFFSQAFRNSSQACST